jgi:hypothetical protein
LQPARAPRRLGTLWCARRTASSPTLLPPALARRRRPPGGLTKLQRRDAGPRPGPARADWAAGSGGAFGRPVYSAYRESSYDVIWSTYAYQANISEWFYKDFGKARFTAR